MNQSFISDILYADIESKAKELTVNSNNTVQPVALMRLGVFVPKPSKSKGESKEIDATKAFSQLEIAKAEGYDDIKITGPRLDMDTVSKRGSVSSTRSANTACPQTPSSYRFRNSLKPVVSPQNVWMRNCV